MLKWLFSKTMNFQPIDPLGDGLAEEIAEEQHESQAISLVDDDEDDVQRFWHDVSRDLHDGGGLDFSE